MVLSSRVVALKRWIRTRVKREFGHRLSLCAGETCPGRAGKNPVLRRRGALLNSTSSSRLTHYPLATAKHRERSDHSGSRPGTACIK